MPDPLPPWRPPPEPLLLHHREVHVWRLGLDVPGLRLAQLRQSLAADELARADRFVFPRDRDRFIVGRGLLRAVLARYLGAEPASLTFDYAAAGKPFLSAPPAGDLHFNLAHSYDLALFAITRSGPVGVDIEQIRPEIDCLGIAAHTFTLAEQAMLRAAPAEQRAAIFFAYWTQKEAYVKAHGAGLSLPLTRLDTGLPPDTLSATRHLPPDDTPWTIVTLHAAPGYAAALASAGPPAHIRLIAS